MLDAIQLDKMTNKDFERYWLDKDGTTFGKFGGGRTGETFSRCRDIVRAFMTNPGNQDLLATCREGMATKACTAVAEGHVLTRDLWKALAGYGKEIASSAKTEPR